MRWYSGSAAYRAEIDGLRAIAVSAVVLYHAQRTGAGFVGVDIFFAISGYLITSLLLRERELTGRIDLPAFYARRVRRILPAALLVIVATLAASRLLLPPQPLVAAAKSGAASAVFGANFFFQLATGGYFDPRAEEMPLLHLWSLAVEEQFYLLWPLLLWLVPGRRAMVVLTLASFIAAELLLRVDPESAFYQMPARFWELGAGGIIATLPVRALPRWLGPAGVLLALAACAFPLRHFPGLGALPAVLGACAVIASVHGGAGNRFLASKPMVGIGLISYSLYLWHWPLLAIYRANSVSGGNRTVRLELCVVAVLLAIASYRYVEQPVRALRGRAWSTVLTGTLASLLVASGAWCWAAYLDREEAARPSDNPLAMAAEDDMPAHWRRCHYQIWDTGPLRKGCGEPARVVMWGDSMALAWKPLLARFGPSTIDYSRDACGPFLGWLPKNPLPGDLKCRDWNELVAHEAAKAEVVVLVARWSTYPAQARTRLRETVERLPGRVIVIGPTPELRDMVPRCIRKDAPQACDIPRPSFEAQAQPVRATLDLPGVEHLEPADWLCDASRCPALKNGLPLYWDSHHISSRAASAYARTLPPQTKTATLSPRSPHR